MLRSQLREHQANRVSVPATRAKALRICLVLPDGELHQQVLADGTVSIGRGRSNSLCLRDYKVSRRHAEIIQIDGCWAILDCGSTNGTFVNDTQVQRTRRLHPGDVVRIGLTRILISLLPELDQKPRQEDSDSSSASSLNGRFWEVVEARTTESVDPIEAARILGDLPG